jgi:hypothetical protein
MNSFVRSIRTCYVCVRMWVRTDPPTTRNARRGGRRSHKVTWLLWSITVEMRCLETTENYRLQLFLSSSFVSFRDGSWLATTQRPGFKSRTGPWLIRLWFLVVSPEKFCDKAPYRFSTAPIHILANKLFLCGLFIGVFSIEAIGRLIKND